MVEESKAEEAMTTIQVAKSVAKELQDLAKWGESYNVVIKRLLNGDKPEEEREPRGDG